MKEKELRRSLAVFPIGSVMKLTDLTARQIRYYEDQGLISPDRTEGNRRMYSLDDMDRLLEIKDYISDGFNIADIKKKYAPKGGEEEFEYCGYQEEICGKRARANQGGQPRSHS